MESSAVNLLCEQEKESHSPQAGNQSDVSPLRRWSGRLGLILFIPLLVLFTETVARASLSDALEWMLHSRVQCGVSTILTGLIFLFLAAIFGLRIGGLVTLSLLALVGAISITKQLLVGLPLFPWDLTLSRQGADIFGAGYFPHPKLHVAAFIAMFATLAVIAWLLPRTRFPLWLRVVTLAICATMLYTVAFCRNTPVQRFLFTSGRIRVITADPKLSYQMNSLALSFLINVPQSIVPAPPGYGKQAVANILGRLDAGSPGPQAEPLPAMGEEQPERPDLILVMNEAFWDPTLLPNVSYDPDPLAFLHSLPEANRGWLVAPVFGGWTCNTEFEVLTSCSMWFLPGGSVPFQQYIHRPLPALPHVLRELGYQTAAIHPYYRWYWRREIVYPLLGIDKFSSLETYGTTPLAGPYTADSWVTQEIIQAVESVKDRPVFVFAVTMQNHGPYEANRYGPDTDKIRIECDLPADSRSMLAVYTRGASDADQMLATLAKYVQERPKKTLLVFFGDHLPYLGPDHQVYRQTGFLQQHQGLVEFHRHRVPVVYFANFEQGPAPQTISANFLALQILRRLQVPPPPLMRMAEHVQKRFPILGATWFMDADGRLGNYGTERDPILKDYEMLQYDLLFGKQYALQPADAG